MASMKVVSEGSRVQIDQKIEATDAVFIDGSGRSPLSLHQRFASLFSVVTLG